MKPEDKKCSESCACVSQQELKNDDQTEVPTPQPIKLDPTHFGDWQINGRAIDF